MVVISLQANDRKTPSFCTLMKDPKIRIQCINNYQYIESRYSGTYTQMFELKLRASVPIECYCKKSKSSSWF